MGGVPKSGQIYMSSLLVFTYPGIYIISHSIRRDKSAKSKGRSRSLSEQVVMLFGQHYYDPWTSRREVEQNAENCSDSSSRLNFGNGK
jgi:hypothetical protein